MPVKKNNQNHMWKIIGILSCLIAITTVINSYSYRKIRPYVPKEPRAEIVDRNAVPLAVNINKYNIKIYPPRVKETDVNAVAQVIHEIAPADYSIDDALNLIRSDKKGVYIKKQADGYMAESMIKEANRKYNCFEIERFTKRYYPQRESFSHVVGFVNKDDGVEGVEYAYNERLNDNKEPLYLSIDSRIQNIFHEQLTGAMNKYNAKSALGMLMNAKTGEMIAMVQIPDFDPNHLKENPIQNISFRPMRDVMEMGSIFKIFNTALAYENGLDSKEYKIDEPLMIYDKFGKKLLQQPIDDVPTFKNYVVKKLGKTSLTAPEIMLHSCNVGSARIALDLPDNAQKEFFHRLHLDETLVFDFGKTEHALAYRNWGPAEHATASFGYGIAVTPMHLLLAVNAVTNGGIYVYPTLLKYKIDTKHTKRVLRNDISEKLREVMARIVEETSARKSKISGVEIGGKTGTVTKRNADGKIDNEHVSTIFAGIFPVAAPQYTMLIILDEPQGTKETGLWKTAAWNVVPTAGQILEQIIPILITNK